MSEQGIHSARLQLYPEELGALEVRLQVQDDKVWVWFGTQQAHAKDAVEAALPELRALFLEQDLTLVDARSGSGGEQPDHHGPLPDPSQRTESTSAASPDAGEPPYPLRLAVDRLVDVYV